MDDVRDPSGKAEAALLARAVLAAIEARSPAAAARAAERLIRCHAERALAAPSKPVSRKARSAA
jgi:hypothetical protein